MYDKSVGRLIGSLDGTFRRRSRKEGADPSRALRQQGDGWERIGFARLVRRREAPLITRAAGQP